MRFDESLPQVGTVGRRSREFEELRDGDDDGERVDIRGNARCYLGAASGGEVVRVEVQRVVG